MKYKYIYILESVRHFYIKGCWGRGFGEATKGVRLHQEAKYNKIQQRPKKSNQINAGH